ncbi:MAG: hypothetical protein HC912_05830 [Saprospiraceae bacterium]|nr:hypothetical protein [Saprospiraceae bacterium]
MTRNSEAALNANRGMLSVAGSGTNQITYTLSGVSFPGLRDNDVWNINVDVTAPNGTSGANSITYLLTGDGFGPTPHTVTNNLALDVLTSCGTDELAGKVFEDLDNDGVDDGASEGGFNGVTVAIYEVGNATPVATPTVAVDGSWSAIRLE